MKVNKDKGITLIALVITIILMLILAGITLSNLTGTGLFSKTKEAKFKTDIAKYQEELNISIYNDMKYDNDEREDDEKFNAKGYENVKKIIPSFDKSYEKKIAVEADKLVYIGLNEEERDWLKSGEVLVSKKITINYIDINGQSIADPYELMHTPNSIYSITSPNLEGYLPVKTIIDGKVENNDIQVDVVYYAICNDLAFTGLDSSGKETTNETNIVAYTVTGIGNCNNPQIAIPKDYNGKPVKKIKAEAFKGNKNITGLIIPESIESVEKNAFQQCSNIKEINLNAKNVDTLAFYLCTSLEILQIGKNVSTLGSQSFMQSAKLSDVSIYSENALNDFDRTFSGCTNLKNFKVNEDNNAYKVIDGVIYSKDETKIVMYPIAKQGDTYTINPNVKYIGNNAFQGNTTLKNIDVPNTVEEIGNRAFSQSNIVTAKINMKKTGDLCFYGCSKLTKVEVESNVTNLSSQMFLNCTKLSDITIKSETAFNTIDRTFIGTNIAEVKLNEDNASYKNVDGVVYSKDGKKLIFYPVAKDGTDFTVPSNVTSIENYAFQGNTRLVNLIVPENIAYIGNNALQNCTKLEKLNINSSKISNYAISNDSALKSVTFGANVTIFDGAIFYNTKNFANITYLGTIEQWNNISKKNNWKQNSNVTTVICSDGTVNL